MNKKTLGWIAGIGSYIGVIFLLTLFPEPTQIWSNGYSDRYNDYEPGFEDPFWYMMVVVAMTLSCIAIGRSVAGANNKQLMPFIYLAIYLGMAVFVADAIVSHLEGVISHLVGMVLTAGTLYGIWLGFIFMQERDFMKEKDNG